ncbi:TrmB family transcriptional regulator [Candidatus Woesearchaeota archaeon]|jgi:HTH-type transcriptional regulator, sugar sensing transcriptional regulator|nr:TrmB family transcriptional regulator [Candidatus Woesearchaeota archaeon]MBT3537319.1 TrmB family transcriptional regulator [Candidatus Woesearchaeota archaeon]MBT4697438.1 TrmB family transcriptional regulator [Candidatus Woesearchaeota archaeon]MBT4716715.1 TrmB family transcriptional regulator [Candidatus Woesearchaeota archaeon]MBT7106371.1 TrmB family transcriptional regulator [Candidatus Woesearchaeota archaeon]
MIVQKNFLSKLKDFGLNTYESKLWTALLSRGISTAGELSDIANVPRSRSYDVLESLEKKGFIVVKIGKPIKYIAVPPEEVLERVKKKISSDAEKQNQVLDTLKDSEILTELNLLHTQGIDLIDPSDLSGAIKGRNNIYNHLDLGVKKAEESITIMTTAEGLTRKTDALKSSLKKAADKGVKIKIATSGKGAEGAVKDLKGIAEVRDSKDIKSRFCIVDGKEVTFMILNDDKVHPTYDVGVWLNTPFFAQSLQALFDSNWNSMSQLK